MQSQQKVADAGVSPGTSTQLAKNGLFCVLSCLVPSDVCYGWFLSDMMLRKNTILLILMDVVQGEGQNSAAGAKESSSNTLKFSGEGDLVVPLSVDPADFNCPATPFRAAKNH